MNPDRKIGVQSALLVSWGVIGLSFGVSILMWRFGPPRIGALLTAVAVAGVVARLWGLHALRGLTMTVAPEAETLSVGQSVNVRYVLRNNKLLPLVWVEVLHDIPVRDCLVPDGSFVRKQLPEEEAVHTGRTEAYLRRLAFLPGGGSLAWDTEWTGAHRGVYRPQSLVLRSGDGFGLTQSTGEVGGLHDRVLVVWPKLVPVRIQPFLRLVWSGSAGRAGWTEDPTVVRGERAYLPGDPWKRIDWRTAARTDELMVRQYETIRPMSVLFVLDVASLEDAEDGISLLASVIRALSLEGIDCGLALPATAERAPLVLRPEDPEVSAEACLFALAELDDESAGARFDEQAVLSAAAGTGQVWVVTQSARRSCCASLTERLASEGARLLCAVREDGAGTAPVCTFGELRESEAAG